MRWLSIDPATKTGIARWEGPRLVSVATLRPMTAGEAKPHGCTKGDLAAIVLLDGRRVIVPHVTTARAWSSLLPGIEAVIIEEAMGFQPKTVAQLGYRRGYIAALCEQRNVAVTEVNTSSWRKVAGDAWGVSFPAKSDAAKVLAQSLVREHFGVECTDDEADAVLVGHWALRTRTVRA